MEPVTLALVGTTVLTEGIKFLYTQAAEVLKCWRDRKAGREVEAQAPIPPPPQALLDGTLAPLAIDFAAVECLHEDIKQLAGVLGDFAGGLEEPDPHDAGLAAAADGLRRALEVVYNQRITFKGEQREPSWPVVIGRAEVEQVIGDVAGVRARLVTGGRIEGTLKAGEVSGRASAVEIDTLGG